MEVRKKVRLLLVVARAYDDEGLHVWGSNQDRVQGLSLADIMKEELTQPVAGWIGRDRKNEESRMPC